jgi:hypothetical protein
MNVVVLHGADAVEPREDHVLAQIEAALRALGHAPQRVGVGDDVEQLVRALKAAEPELVFNLAESCPSR